MGDPIPVIERIYNKCMELLEIDLEYLKSSGGQGVIQGGLVFDNFGEVVNRFGRISKNPMWYREYYQEHGRPPGKKALRELALKHLREGFPDDLGIIPPNEEFIRLEKMLNTISKRRIK